MTVRRSVTPFRRVSVHDTPSLSRGYSSPQGFRRGFPQVSTYYSLIYTFSWSLALDLPRPPFPFLPIHLYIVTVIISANIWQSYSLMPLFFDDISTVSSRMDMAYRTDYRIGFNLLFSTISLIFVQRKSFDFSLLLFLFFPVIVQQKTSM